VAEVSRRNSPIARGHYPPPHDPHAELAHLRQEVTVLRKQMKDSPQPRGRHSRDCSARWLDRGRGESKHAGGAVLAEHAVALELRFVEELIGRFLERELGVFLPVGGEVEGLVAG
jgi:hypothetical protein